jgi:mannose-6-phosphate isomerase-like protein (cupin superfamily)
MPTIFEPNDLPVRKKDGVTHITLADAARLGTDALQVEHVKVEAGKASEFASVMEAERFLYVIRGTGQAQVGDETFPLAPESMLWIEPGEMFTVEAGEEQLGALVCKAPAKTTDQHK